MEQLTVATVRDLVRAIGPRREIRDGGSPGLVLRVDGDGVGASWVWKFGRGGRKVTLGRYPGLTLAQARDLASSQRFALAQGMDPAALRREAKAGVTLNELAIQFKRDHVARLGERTQIEYGRLLDQAILPTLGKLPARALVRATVARWHQGMRETPRRANLALCVLSTMMGLAEIWGHREPKTNPCEGVPRYDEPRRQRYLSPDELGRVAHALPHSVPGDALRLLILTGLRLGEVTALSWRMVDLPRAVILLPAKAHKTGRKKGDKVVQLPAAACALLDGMTRSISGKVFLISRTQIERVWAQARDKAGCPDVHLHDLRHTFVSWGAAQGLSLPILGALVGHTQASTTQRYAHLAQSPLRDAVEQIGAALDAAMKKAPEGA